jgi:hypothetical protein
LRACLRGEGGFDTAMFLALGDRLSIPEAIEISTTMTLASIEAAEFGEFFEQWMARPATAQPGRAQPTELRPEVVIAQLEAQRKQIEHMFEADQGRLHKHRRAVAMSSAGKLHADLLNPEQVETLDRLIKSHLAGLAAIDTELATLRGASAHG